VRLLAHARLTLMSPDAALVTNVGACAFCCHLGFLWDGPPLLHCRR
jgi:hypothetical protein